MLGVRFAALWLAGWPAGATISFMMAAACGGASHPTVERPVTFIHDEGTALSFDEVARRMSAVDVALVGELHGHPAGLETARRLFDRVATSSPRAALSLEFLERDEQAALDAYLAGSIDDAELTWRRGGTALPKPHQAMIDRARAAGLPVIAANAPRRFVKQARLEGWDVLRALPDDQRAWFTIPEAMPEGAYRARFAAAMGMGGGRDAGHGAPDPAKLDGFFRAQVLWDATMADAIGKALALPRAPVVHVVGRFHVEHDGGLAQLLRRAHPSARIFTIVMSEEPEADDRGRGDVIAFVGPAAADPH